MVAPIDDMVTQKILKALDEYGDTLKKPAHVEIHDDEEREEWDERDKADNERIKQFEKLFVDTLAMKEKMDKMQLAFHKVQGMDDCLCNMGGISLKTPYYTTSKVQDFRCRKV